MSHAKKLKVALDEAENRLLEVFLSYDYLDSVEVDYSDLEELRSRLSEQDTYADFSKKAGDTTEENVSPSTLRMALETALYSGSRLTNYQELGGMGASAIEWSPPGKPEERFKVELKGRVLSIHSVTKDGHTKKLVGKTNWKKDEVLSSAIGRAWE